MHTSRTALIITSGIGMVSTLFTWRYYDKVAEAGFSGFLRDAAKLAENGIQIKWGLATLAIFALIILVAVLGKKAQPIVQGPTKFALLVINITNVAYHIVVISVILVASYQKPAFGLYIAFICSIVALLLPYVISKEGKFDPMTPKEIIKDIEENADQFEDRAEAVGEKLEDSIEDRFKKKKKEEDTENKDQ